MALRFSLLILIWSVFYGALGLKLYKLQIENGGTYLKQARSQTIAAGLFLAPRGSIYFTDKNQRTIPAAITKPFPTIFAIPKKVANPKEAALALVSIVGIPFDDLFARLNKPNDPYEPLVEKATNEQVEKVGALDIEGIVISDEEHRFYPLGRAGSQILGFTALDSEGNSVGKYGLELFFNTLLSGQNGSLDKGSVRDSKPGKNLVLHIDYNVQSRAEAILTKLIKDWGAVAGSVIVQDPQTGKILAMTGMPDFDPNDYGSSELKNFMNGTVQGIYEPGSIFKVITMAAGIDSGAITPDTTYVDTGALVLNGKKIRNWDLKAYGKTTMTGVLEHSLNIGAAYAEKKTGHAVFRRYVEQFGFTAPTGIKLPGEVRGSIAPLIKDPRDINFATASFGQGVSVTAIELVNAISAIANGGVLMRPLLIADENPEVVRRVITEDTAKQVAGMMVSAVDKAQVAKISGYTVAGKTGTAQVPDFKRGGYTKEVINTYVGFAPASNPRFTILIKLEKPAGAPLAGLTVVPAFRDLAEFLLNYYSIPPDRVENAGGTQ